MTSEALSEGPLGSWSPPSCLVTQFLQTTNSRKSPGAYKLNYFHFVIIEASSQIFVIVLYTDSCLIKYNLNLPHTDRQPL